MPSSIDPGRSKGIDSPALLSRQDPVRPVRDAALDRISSSRSETITMTGLGPTFENNHGVPEIRINVREFSCIGASPPQDHPRVYINMSEQGMAQIPRPSGGTRQSTRLPTLRLGAEGRWWHGQLTEIRSGAALQPAHPLSHRRGNDRAEAKARKINRQLAVYARDTALKKNKGYDVNGYDSNADHSAPSTPARLRMHGRR